MVHSVEKDIMVGMIGVLNLASEEPILSEEQYNMRLKELKEFEEETNFMLVNSPNCPIDLQSVIEVSNETTQDFKECDNIEDIVEFASQKDMLVYVRVDGANLSITYTDGIIAKISIDNLLMDIKKICNIPYRIDKSGTYIVQGKIVVADRVNFFVHNVIKEDGVSLKEDLQEAKDLMFDIVPNWLATNFAPKNLQGVIDYIFDYAKDEELPNNGIVFKFNDVKDGRCIMYKAQNE